MGFSKKELSYQPSGGRTGRPRKLVKDGQQECSICCEWKPLEEFYPAKNTFNGRETRCIQCTLKRSRNYHNENTEFALRRLWMGHKGVANRKTRSRRKQLAAESCVTPELLVELWKSQDGKCAVTGRQMTHIHGNGPMMSNVTIDRIDSQEGYVPENIRLVCKAVNWMKNAMSDQEMFDWADAILNGPLNRQDQEHALP